MLAAVLAGCAADVADRGSNDTVEPEPTPDAGPRPPRAGSPGGGGAGGGGASGGGSAGADARAGSTGTMDAGVDRAATETGPSPDAGGAPDTAPVGGALAITFDPPKNTFTGSVDVKLAVEDPAAKIYYTLDDRPPTAASTPYAGPIKLTASTVIRAVAVSGATTGPVANRSYLALAADVAQWSSNLPIVVLHSARSRVVAKADGVKPGSATVFQPAAGGRATLNDVAALNTRVGINVRGSSSSTWPKKSYKVEFWGGATDEDVQLPLLGMPREGDWVFFGPYAYDRSLVRNSVMYTVSNQLGRWAPQTRFAEVFYTDMGRPVSAADYIGFYVIMEKIEADRYRLPIAQIQPTDTTAPNVTGGYIFKVDRLDPGEMGIRAGLGPNNIWGGACPAGIRGSCGIGGFQSIGVLAFHEPAEVDILKVPQQAQYLRDTLNTFATTLANKGDYGALIDVPAWIDHHIIKLFVKDMDAHRLSAYFHKDRNGKLVAGPVWDFDRTLGCTTDPRCPVATVWDAAGGEQGDDSVNSFYYGWWRGLFADPKFKTAYFARFRELLDKQLSEAHLYGLIDMYVAQIGTEAPTRNWQKWTTDVPSGGHAGEVTRLKNWIRARITWIKKCLDLPDPVTCRG